MKHANTFTAVAKAAPVLDTTPFEAALAAVRQAERTMRKLDKADTAASEAAQAICAANEDLPRPAILTVVTPPMTLTRGEKSVQTDPCSFTYKTAESIERSNDLSPELKIQMLAALTEYDAAQLTADEASGVAAAERAYKEAHEAYMASYHATLAAVEALMLVPTRDPAAIQTKRAYIRKYDDCHEDETAFLRAMLEGTLAADEPPPPPPPPRGHLDLISIASPIQPVTDPATMAFEAAKRANSEIAHHGVAESGITEDEAWDREKSTTDALLSTPPVDIRGVAARLGVIVAVMLNKDWDCHLCHHKRGEIIPPTADELWDEDGADGTGEAPARALAFLHLGIERMVVGPQRSAAHSDLEALIAEAEQCLDEAAGLPNQTHQAEIDALDAQHLVLRQRFFDAPIANSADVAAKLRWVRRGFEDGETGYEEQVIDQVLAFLGGPHPDGAPSEPERQEPIYALHQAPAPHAIAAE